MRRAVAAVDLVAVVVFILIGRASHHHAETVGGFISTAWPFAVGVASGWLTAARRPPASVLTGLVVCVVTVSIGMTLRVVAGQGTAAAFIAVALCFLGAAMVGGRLLLTFALAGSRPAAPIGPDQPVP
jgi:hypothetical protein